MWRTILFFCFINIAWAQSTDSLGAKPKGFIKQIKESSDEFFFNEHPPKVHNKPSVHKNTIYLQAMGDTPYIGTGYRYRVLDKKTWSAELGFGLGFSPHIFTTHIPRPKNYSFSHGLQLIYKRQRFVAPSIGYSGIWFSSEYYNGKTFNYEPAPNIGLRFGNSDSFALNLLWFGYFKKSEYSKLSADEKIQTVLRKNVWSIPSANLQFSF